MWFKPRGLRTLYSDSPASNSYFSFGIKLMRRIKLLSHSNAGEHMSGRCSRTYNRTELWLIQEGILLKSYICLFVYRYVLGSIQRFFFNVSCKVSKKEFEGPTNFRKKNQLKIFKNVVTKGDEVNSFSSSVPVSQW